MVWCKFANCTIVLFTWPFHFQFYFDYSFEIKSIKYTILGHVPQLIIGLRNQGIPHPKIDLVPYPSRFLKNIPLLTLRFWLFQTFSQVNNVYPQEYAWLSKSLPQLIFPKSLWFLMKKSWIFGEMTKMPFWSLKP